MDELTPQFDDVALKTAIRSAMGVESAPRELRQRISIMLAAGSRPLPVWRRRRVQLYAVAAVILIVGASLGTYLLLQTPERQIPAWFADAMVTTHEQCKAQGDHHLLANVSDTDLVGMRKTLREMLGHPALVAMLGEGWKFKGAGICKVGNVPAAHLMFSRDDETISIFSISDRLLYRSDVPEGATYAQTENGHELAGFVYGGAIHCLVADSTSHKVSLGQIIQMRDALRKSPAGLAPPNTLLRVAH